MKRLTKRAQESNRHQYKYDIAQLGGVHPPLPRTRSECPPAGTPCGFVRCKHNLAYDIEPRGGGIKHNFPDLEIDELPATCALQVADKGGQTLQEVGAMLCLTRERVRQVETRAFRKILASHGADVLREFVAGIEDARPLRRTRKGLE